MLKMFANSFPHFNQAPSPVHATQLKNIYLENELYKNLSGYANSVHINLFLNLKKLQSKFREKHSNGENMYQNKEIKMFFRKTIYLTREINKQKLVYFLNAKEQVVYTQKTSPFFKVYKGRCLRFLNESTPPRTASQKLATTLLSLVSAQLLTMLRLKMHLSDIPNFRTCLLLPKFSTRWRRYSWAEKQHPEFFPINSL